MLDRLGVKRNEAETKATTARADRNTKGSGHTARSVNLASPDSREATEAEEVRVKAQQGPDQHLEDHGPRMDDTPS
jgi:hypothetical protein